MSRLRLSVSLWLAAPLAVLVLAACGDDSITSDAAQESCVKGRGTPAEKQLSEAQKVDYCKCVLPKLEQAGFENASDFEDAVKDPKGIAVIRACAQKHLVRGYS
jgi:hypothetical protein